VVPLNVTDESLLLMEMVKRLNSCSPLLSLMIPMLCDLMTSFGEKVMTSQAAVIDGAVFASVVLHNL